MCARGRSAATYTLNNFTSYWLFDTNRFLHLTYSPGLTIMKPNGDGTAGNGGRPGTLEALSPRPHIGGGSKMVAPC